MNIFNEKELEKVFNELLYKQLIDASEKIIQKSLVEYEKEIRKKVADFALTVIESNYDISMQQNRLLISVKIGEMK